MDYEMLMRLKGAQTDLIAAVGGIERAARISSMATSTVGRWNSPNETALMPLTAVIALEKAARFPWVSRVLAGENGWTIAERDPVEGSIASICEKSLLANRSAADLAIAIAQAAGDGNVTATEATICDKAAARCEAELAEIRKMLSAIKITPEQAASVERLFPNGFRGRS